MELKDITITVTDQHGDEARYTLKWDAPIEDIIHIFKVILLWLTFAQKTIDDMFAEEE